MQAYDQRDECQKRKTAPVWRDSLHRQQPTLSQAFLRGSTSLCYLLKAPSLLRRSGCLGVCELGLKGYRWEWSPLQDGRINTKATREILPVLCHGIELACPMPRQRPPSRRGLMSCSAERKTWKPSTANNTRANTATNTSTRVRTSGRVGASQIRFLTPSASHTRLAGDGGASERVSRAESYGTHKTSVSLAPGRNEDQPPKCEATQHATSNPRGSKQGRLLCDGNTTDCLPHARATQAYGQRDGCPDTNMAPVRG